VKRFNWPASRASPTLARGYRQLIAWRQPLSQGPGESREPGTWTGESLPWAGDGRASSTIASIGVLPGPVQLAVVKNSKRSGYGCMSENDQIIMISYIKHHASPDLCSANCCSVGGSRLCRLSKVQFEHNFRSISLKKMADSHLFKMPPGVPSYRSS
jgi:hypothetical protein